MPPKTANPPPSAFAEPSEPSQVVPADKPRDTLAGPQEENPQVVVTRSDSAARAKHASPSKPSSNESSKEKNSRSTGEGAGGGELPAAAFAEPSEPSQVVPADKSRDQVARPQAENPQAVVTKSPEVARAKAKL